MDSSIARDGVRDDDRRVLDELARRYGAPLRRLFQRRTGGRGDVEDLVQETFLRLAGQADLKSIARIEGYIFQVAKNVLRDRARRTAVRAAGNELEQICFGVDDEEPSPEGVLLGREALGLAVRALFELPERVRTVFILHRFEGLQYKEIAQRLGVSQSTVEKDIMKTLVHLGSRLGTP